MIFIRDALSMYAINNQSTNNFVTSRMRDGMLIYSLISIFFVYSTLQCAVATLLLLFTSMTSAFRPDDPLPSKELCLCVENCRIDDIKCQGDTWVVWSFDFSEPKICADPYRACLYSCHTRFGNGQQFLR